MTQVTHVRIKKSNIQGKSLNVIKVIFHTIRNCSLRKECAPSGSKFFPLREVPVWKERNRRESLLGSVVSLWRAQLFQRSGYAVACWRLFTVAFGIYTVRLTWKQNGSVPLVALLRCLSYSSNGNVLQSHRPHRYCDLHTGTVTYTSVLWHMHMHRMPLTPECKQTWLVDFLGNAISTKRRCIRTC